MKEYLFVQNRVASQEGGKTYVTAVRASFMALRGEGWPNLEHLEWTPWVTVSIALVDPKEREMIEVTGETWKTIMDSRLELVRLREKEGRCFKVIVKRALKKRSGVQTRPPSSRHRLQRTDIQKAESPTRRRPRPRRRVRRSS